jgi:hypothetical protein
MAALYTWLTRQFEDRLVEPNSSLGQAIAYLLRHWEKLTLFLREPGAPLDNNICERALKRAILHRKNALFYKTEHGARVGKNALFYKTEHGARVGDLFMSLIHTCQLNDTDPFDYLTTLQRQAESLASNPSKWMPWNYRDALASIATPTSSSP